MTGKPTRRELLDRLKAAPSMQDAFAVLDLFDRLHYPRPDTCRIGGAGADVEDRELGDAAPSKPGTPGRKPTPKPGPSKPRPRPDRPPEAFAPRGPIRDAAGCDRRPSEAHR